GDIGIGVAPVIAIRGSRLGAAAVYVDGAPVRFQAFGTQAMAPGTLGIDRISVTTGVPAASVLDAGGGVISYVTAAGGQRLTGIWRTETDEPFGDASTVGYNRFEGWVGGPVPGVARLTWAASGTLYGQRSQYYGRGAADQPAYVLGGLDTLVQSTDASGSTVTVPLPRDVPARRAELEPPPRDLPGRAAKRQREPLAGERSADRRPAHPGVGARDPRPRARRRLADARVHRRG